MDKVTKALKRLQPKERKVFLTLLQLIEARQLAGLDIKKLAGHDDIFRLRKGNYRIIFKIDDRNNVYILTLERRSDQTYSGY